MKNKNTVYYIAFGAVLLILAIIFFVSSKKAKAAVQNDNTVGTNGSGVDTNNLPAFVDPDFYSWLQGRMASGWTF